MIRRDICSICLEPLHASVPEDDSVRITDSATTNTSESTNLPIDNDPLNATVIGADSVERVPLSLIQQIPEDEYIAKLDGCQHEFHYVCLLPWVDAKSSCPDCRAPATSIIISTPAPNECHIRTDKLESAVTSKSIPLARNADQEELEALEAAALMWDEDNRAIIGSCFFCGDDNNEDELMICDGCNLTAHLECDDSLAQLPSEAYLCRTCRDRGRVSHDPNLPYYPSRIQIANYLSLAGLTDGNDVYNVYLNVNDPPLRTRSLLIGIFGASRNPHRVRIDNINGVSTNTEFWTPPLFHPVPMHRLLTDDEVRSRRLPIVSHFRRPVQPRLLRTVPIYRQASAPPAPLSNQPDSSETQAWSILEALLHGSDSTADASSSNSGANRVGRILGETQPPRFTPTRFHAEHPRPGHATALHSSQSTSASTPAQSGNPISTQLRRPGRRSRPIEENQPEEQEAPRRKRPCQRRQTSTAAPSESSELPPAPGSSKPSFISTLLVAVESTYTPSRSTELSKSVLATDARSSPSPHKSPMSSRETSPVRETSPSRISPLSSVVMPAPGYSGTLNGQDSRRGRSGQPSRNSTSPELPHLGVVTGSASPETRHDNPRDWWLMRRYTYNDRGPDSIVRAVQASVRKHMTCHSTVSSGQFGAINAKVARIVRQKLDSLDVTDPTYEATLSQYAEEEVQKEINALASSSSSSGIIA